MKHIEELDLNEIGTVKALLCKGEMHRRFLDIGLCRGTKVRKVSVSPMGDPSCYLINGTMVAIRKCDAMKVGIDS